MNEKPRDSLISAEENRAMFDFIAGWYDSTNKILSFGLDGYWRRRAVGLLRPEPDLIYLDVGCGTGDISLEILRHCRGSRVVGIDPSERMLEISRDKVKAARLDNSITLLKGDALDLQFRGGSFDGVITAFCIRNVTHRSQALREFRRVLRPGGRLVILELTDPEGPIMRPLFRIYSNVVMPFVTKIMSSLPAYRYLSNSMADFPRAEEFLRTMELAGFVDASYSHMTGGITTMFVGAAPRG